MERLAKSLLLVSLVLILSTGAGQAKPDDPPAPVVQTDPVGGRCEGCELLFAGMPKVLNEVDTSAGWRESGQKLRVTGTVFRRDGKTPAPGAILYYYQTNNAGLYAADAATPEAAKRHGHIRGWVKTDAKGRYSIFTNRPAPYPNGNIPAHIHIFVKEPAIANPYYIDELVFEDDNLLTAERRKELENRGGSGILKIKKSGNLQTAEHNVILGLNIPNYPVQP